MKKKDGKGGEYMRGVGKRKRRNDAILMSKIKYIVKK